MAALVPDAKLLDALGPFLAADDPETRAFAAASILSINHHTVQQKP
jgi:hypothetical protein